MFNCNINVNCKSLHKKNKCTYIYLYDKDVDI